MQSSPLPPPVFPAGPAPATSRWTISPIAIGGVFVALALQLIFAISYIGALHEPQPHDVPYGVVAPPQVAAAVLQQLRVGGGSAFTATSEPSTAALLHALDERSLYGGLVFTPRGIQLIVADAAGLAPTQALTAFAQGVATAQKAPLSIQHTHVLPPADSRGLSAVYLVFAWVFGGYLCATVLSTVRGTGYVNRLHALTRILLLAGYAIVSGILGAVVAEPLSGALSGDFAQLAAIGALLVFSVAAVTMALQLLLGVAGTLVAMIAFVLLGNPSSGGVFPPEFLPGFWRVIGPWLPNAAGFTLVRNTVYFGGNAVGGAIVLLAVYALAGSALLIVFAARGRQRSPLGGQLELAIATAASAAA